MGSIVMVSIFDYWKGHFGAFSDFKWWNGLKLESLRFLLEQIMLGDKEWRLSKNNKWTCNRILTQASKNLNHKLIYKPNFPRICDQNTNKNIQKMFILINYNLSDILVQGHRFGMRKKYCWILIIESDFYWPTIFVNYFIFFLSFITVEWDQVLWTHFHSNFSDFEVFLI